MKAAIAAYASRKTPVPKSSGAGRPVSRASASVKATCSAPVAAHEAASAHITRGRKRGDAKTDIRFSLV